MSCSILWELFFQLVSILDLKFSSLKNQKYLKNSLIWYMHLFIPNYLLQYAKRLVTWFQGKRKFIWVVWIFNWALQIHYDRRVLLGANKLVSKVSVETDYRVLQKIDVILYSVYILRQSFTRPFEVKQLPSSWSCS